MSARALLMLTTAIAAVSAHAQAPAPASNAVAPAERAAAAPPLRTGPGVQAARDAREPEVLAQCKHPPAPAQPFTFPPALRPSSTPKAYMVKGIAGVVAAGKEWATVWHVEGNNADGIVATPDGGLMLAQNDNSAIVKLDKDGKEAVAYRDTPTSGALSVNKKGELFVVERALNPAIWELSPQRKLFANRIDGDPFDCLGSVLNDLSADAKGGVYFTQGGLFYADPSGKVTRYGENLSTNGVILSRDEKTLYVTNRGTIAAFDVQADGSLTNQREFGKLPEGLFGDGSTIDAQGRLYVTGGAMVHVFSPKGEYLGAIDAPFVLISVTFGGPGKQTLYAVGESGDAPKQAATILALPMLAKGYAGRPK